MPFHIVFPVRAPTRDADSNPPQAGSAANAQEPVKALTEVLVQNEEVRGLVDEAAEDLSSVNAGLKRVLDHPSPPSHIEKALVETESVEDKVQEAADKLAVVNDALKDAVAEREALEVQLAEVTERERASRHASFHDPLTGLANRALSDDRLQHGLAQARRHGWQLAVMFIDLDDFKQINDTYGHDAGDIVLKTIAARLVANGRQDDTLSRHGGDEFLYLVTEYESEHDLAAIADKFVSLIQAPCMVRAGDSVNQITVSASIGIAVFPRHAETAEGLINSADAAMYQAKRSRQRLAFAPGDD